MTADVRTEIRDRVAVLTVSDPARRNAMNLAIAAKLVAAVDAAVADDGVGAIVVTGEEPAFCAGADLGELAAADPDTLRAVYGGFIAIADCPLPTVAAVNGAAVGAGMNLALACDVRLAGPTARFDSRFLQIGLHPGGGYTWMLTRAVGNSAAAALTLFGESADAAEAERIGLVHRVVDGGVVDAAVTMAARAAAAPKELVVATKATLRSAAVLDTQAEVLEIEVARQAVSIRSPQAQELIATLRERIRGSAKR
ncbi:MAG: enoyl-CoA hydratase [Pseudonocardia sp.]|nr:enoyl-CoA hydratase [Pseudonocardia sp.]